MRSASSILQHRRIVVLDSDTTTPAGRLALVRAVLSARAPRARLQLLARGGDADAYALTHNEARVDYEVAPCA